jgi:6-pyruvoyltetrahydropterin/6-carboxytetrahydropterin synthase
MPKIRVTKRFHFEMAHTLYEYDGLCRNIHGHSYNLEVTLIGEPRKEPNHPKDGMVMDFGELKKMVKAEIVDRFDHALMVNNLVPESQLELLQKTTDRIIIVEFQPLLHLLPKFYNNIYPLVLIYLASDFLKQLLHLQSGLLPITSKNKKTCLKIKNKNFSYLMLMR